MAYPVNGDICKYVVEQIKEVQCVPLKTAVML